MQYFVVVVDYFGGPGGTIALMVGIIGIVLAYVFYRRSSPRLNMCYARVSSNIFKQLPLIDIKAKAFYDNQEIPTLSVTRLIFWNKGLRTLNKDDIALGAPLRICGDIQTKILNYRVIALDNEANNFQISRNTKDENLSLNLDYVDKNEGIVIEIIHTGDKETSIYIDGQVKGHGHVRLKKKAHIITDDVMVFSAMISCGLFIILPVALFLENYNSNNKYNVVITMSVTFMSLIFLIPIFKKVRNFINNRRSNSLRTFLKGIVFP